MREPAISGESQPHDARAVRPCMGGWCLLREACRHYCAPGPSPAERLCMPGHDGAGADFPVVLHRPAGSWARGAGALLARATPFDGIGIAA